VRFWIQWDNAWSGHVVSDRFGVGRCRVTFDKGRQEASCEDASLWLRRNFLALSFR
jgi:hypothetical protein